MASRFGAHLKVWFLLVPVLAIAVMPAIPDRSLFEVPGAESASLVASVGAERADAATRSANDLFRRSFVANGLLHRTLSASGPCYLLSACFSMERLAVKSRRPQPGL